MKPYTGLYLVLSLLVICIMSCRQEEVLIKPAAFSAFGDIKSDVDAFRDLLGDNNINYLGSKPEGRREINWDVIPDSLAIPNSFTGTYFNDRAYHQARGAEFSTPGSRLMICADSDNPTGTAPSFANFNVTYTSMFPTYSGERMISPQASNIIEVRFYIPGTSTPAVVKGVGAVFIDVDRAETSSISLFDQDNNSLGTYYVPVMKEGQAFLGLLFETPMIHRARITLGNTALGPDDKGNKDISVLDDFIFSEPQP